MKLARAKTDPEQVVVTKVEDARVIDRSGSLAASRSEASRIFNSVPELFPRGASRNAGRRESLHPSKLMSENTLSTEAETGQQRFERILDQAPLKGLKAIFSHLGTDRAILRAGVLVANTFEELVARLGHQLNLTNQIHVQDAYSRLGREGGIKAVLPYYDIPTQSSFPTLVNFDRALSTTPKGVAFFNVRLSELKRQLGAQE